MTEGLSWRGRVRIVDLFQNFVFVRENFFEFCLFLHLHWGVASFCAGKKLGEETAAGDCTKYGFSLFTCAINFLLLCRSKSSTLHSPFSLKILWGPDHFGASFWFLARKLCLSSSTNWSGRNVWGSAVLLNCLSASSKATSLFLLAMSCVSSSLRIKSSVVDSHRIFAVDQVLAGLEVVAPYQR